MKRVAVIPLKQFLEARSDSELLTKLAASVERAAVVKYLRHRADVVDGRLTESAESLREIARDIEKGAHV